MTSPAPHLSLVPQITRSAPDSISLSVQAKPAELAGVRKAVGQVARGTGLDAERCADVALAVGEACANVVVHAYREGEPGALHVSAQHVGEGLRVVIADDGQGLAPREDSPGLGLGLPLMAALTSALEFRTAQSGGTEIEMLFATPGTARDAGVLWPRTA